MKCRPILNGAAEYLSQTKWLQDFITSWVRSVLQRWNPLSLRSVRESVLSCCLLGWITYSVEAALCGGTRWQIVGVSSCIIKSETRLFLPQAKIRSQRGGGYDWSVVHRASQHFSAVVNLISQEPERWIVVNPPSRLLCRWMEDACKSEQHSHAFRKRSFSAAVGTFFQICTVIALDCQVWGRYPSDHPTPVSSWQMIPYEPYKKERHSSSGFRYKTPNSHAPYHLSY